MSRSLTKKPIAAFLFLAIPEFALAQAPSPAGRWEGAIELPGEKLGVLVTLAAGDGGAWSGAIDISAQGGNEALVIQPDGVYKAKRTGREGGPS